MLAWITRNKKLLIGVSVGMIGGYMYYSFVGCASGSCAITSKPLNSMLYFGVLGGLIADMFKKNQPINKNVQ